MDKKKCPNCNKELNSDSNYCPNCGFNLVNDLPDVTAYADAIIKEHQALSDSNRKRSGKKVAVVSSPKRSVILNIFLILIIVLLIFSVGYFVYIFNHNKYDADKTLDEFSYIFGIKESNGFVDKNIFSIELTIPKEFRGDDKDAFNFEIDKNMQLSGIISKAQNKDGSMTLKVTRGCYKEFLNEFLSIVDESIIDMTNESDPSLALSSVTYSEDLSTFDILVDENVFNPFGYLISYVFYMEGAAYQLFNGVPEDDVDVLINFCDVNTEELICSFNKSDLENKDFSSEETLIDTVPDDPIDFESASKVPLPDESGDYIGDIMCPLPPISSSYKIHNVNDVSDCIVLYVDNIDNGNFNFHFTSAKVDTTGTFYEDIIFLEHTAHYNGNGYYEFLGNDYHLYFKYNDSGDNASQKTIEVYGLDGLIDPNNYGENVEYNGLTGNLFRQGIPGAG